jgi:predicted NAD/FAD-dependent oxidoreductase
MTRVAVIGAGFAGLACARRLVQAGVQPVLFDKERGIGGRVSTRRADELQFDHFAQYVTATAVHRWRYARVTASLGQPFLRDAGGSLYLGGDWCIGPSVEAAWTSGTAIANDLLARMR